MCKKIWSCIVIVFFMGLVFSYQIHSKETGKKTDPKKEIKKTEDKKKPSIKVTFIELGSVKCIPCKMMQPIMKEIEEEYKDRVKVVFYDIWTKEGSPYADKYKVRVIPTQVFLDENEKEFFRHEGFFPKKDIIKVLEDKGVK
jgi:thioredoxin 1